MMTTRSVRMRLLHGEVRFGTPLASPIFFAPPVLVHMYLLAQRIYPVDFSVPLSGRSFLCPLLDSLKVATGVHNTGGRQIYTILGVPLVWNRCYVHSTHETLAHLVDTMVNMYHVDIARLWFAGVCSVPVDFLAHFVLGESLLARNCRLIRRDKSNVRGSVADGIRQV
jgi:hypothetical protein